jgi:uncharacterized DUF497 family protein
MDLHENVYVCHIQMMIDMARLTGFQWDTGNDRKSADKYKVSRAEAEQVFFNEPLLIVADERHSRRDERLHALGRTDDGRILLIAFALHDDRRLPRVISARDANRKERARYGESA